MEPLNEFMRNVSIFLEDLRYEEGRSYRRGSGRTNPYSMRSYYEEVDPPYLLIFAEKGREEIFSGFLRASLRIAKDYSRDYSFLILGSEEGTSPILQNFEEVRGKGIEEKDWVEALEKALGKILKERPPKAMISLIYDPPPSQALQKWKRIWREVDFLAVLGPKSLGKFANLSDYFLLY